jgi:hypothetical protein
MKSCMLECWEGRSFGNKRPAWKSASRDYNLQIFAIEAARIISSAVILSRYKLQKGTGINTFLFFIVLYDVRTRNFGI